MSGHSHILFSAGGLSLAADSASVHCIHDELIIQSEDDTQDWFLGLAVADERLLPITDLGVYLNGNPSVGRIIEVDRGFGIAGLKIDEVRGVSQNRPERVESDHSVSTISSPLTSLTVIDLGQHHRVVDFASLLQSVRFLNVQYEPA